MTLGLFYDTFTVEREVQDMSAKRETQAQSKRRECRTHKRNMGWDTRKQSETHKRDPLDTNTKLKKRKAKDTKKVIKNESKVGDTNAVRKARA